MKQSRTALRSAWSGGNRPAEVAKAAENIVEHVAVGAEHRIIGGVEHEIDDIRSVADPEEPGALGAKPPGRSQRGDGVDAPLRGARHDRGDWLMFERAHERCGLKCSACGERALVIVASPALAVGSHSVSDNDDHRTSIAGTRGAHGMVGATSSHVDIAVDRSSRTAVTLDGMELTRERVARAADRQDGGLAVFDLDRTIVAGSSLAVLGAALVRRGLVERRVLGR